MVSSFGWRSTTGGSKSSLVIDDPSTNQPILDPKVQCEMLAAHWAAIAKHRGVDSVNAGFGFQLS